jgi:hypothetical protein
MANRNNFNTGRYYIKEFYFSIKILKDAKFKEKYCTYYNVRSKFYIVAGILLAT